MERIETGVIRFNDDWPGIFIRGDRALAMAAHLETLDSVLGKGTFFSEELRAMITILSSCSANKEEMSIQHITDYTVSIEKNG